MAKKRSSKRIGRGNGYRLFFWLLVIAVVVFLYFTSNNFSASTNTSAKVAETFDAVDVSPSSYKVQLVDEAGSPLKADVLSKISISSQLKGKNCGPKGSLPDHPNGGCYTITKLTEDAVTVNQDGSMSFQNKLYHVGQTFEYSNKKQKKYDYYFSGSPQGNNFIAWNINKIIVRTADKKTELVSVPITAKVYLQKDVTKAKVDIAAFNSLAITIKIPVSKIVTTMGSNAGTFAGIPAPVSPEVIASDSFTAQFVRGGQLVAGQNYTLYNWYYECTIESGKKEKNCTKTQKYQGESSMGYYGKAKVKVNLINVGSDYFLGEVLGNNRFKILSKTEVVALDGDGRKIGSKTISSPFYRPKLNLVILRVMDSTSRSNNKQKMLDKFNQFIQRDYIIKMR